MKPNSRFRSILRSIRRMTITLIILLVVFSAIVYLAQDRLIFFPRQYGADSQFSLDRYEKIVFETEKDGPQLAYYLGPKSDGELPEKLWIMTGGNGSLALGWDFVSTPVARKNPTYGCLLVEYPGYGANAGKPSRTGIQQVTEGAIAALAMHLKTEVDTLKFRSSFLGHSLGCAVAFETAADWKRPEVIALAPFTSLREMAGNRVGPLSHLVRHRWDNRAAIRSILEQPGNGKITICHGTRDGIVPVIMGKTLSEISPEKIRYFEYPDLGHNDIPMALREQLISLMTR